MSFTIKKGWIINIVIVAILATGYFIARRSGAFKKTIVYYAYYPTVKGLQASSMVQMKGVRIGKISDIDVQPDGMVRVSLAIKKDVRIPQGTVAILTSGGLTGDKSIRLDVGNGPGYMTEGGSFLTLNDSQSKDVSVKVTPYMEIAKSMLRGTDTAIRGLRTLIGSGVINPLEKTVKTLETDMSSYAVKSAQLNAKVGDAAKSINGAEQGAAKLSKSSTGWKGSLKELAEETKPGNIDIKKEVSELQASVKQLSSSFKNYNSSDTAYTSADRNIKDMNAELKETQKDGYSMSILGKSKKKK